MIVRSILTASYLFMYGVVACMQSINYPQYGVSNDYLKLLLEIHPGILAFFTLFTFLLLWHKQLLLYSVCKVGTIRLVTGIVLRKRIGNEVRWFGIYCWEEEFQYHFGYDNSWQLSFFPTKFITKEEVSALFRLNTNT